MAQRTEALYDGKIIGIESVFTVIGGKQVNIPERIDDLRKKSRKGQLFCPCGCGANLILVAGDKNLREQHFRIKNSEDSLNCHMITEGKISVDSKIVLKCWLDDKIKADDLETRVPISMVNDCTRKYEFSFISRKKKIALNYCHERANLSDEKLEILDSNGAGIRIIHVVDFSNGNTNGQYPEWLMKIQKRQKYCLLLSIQESDYDKALLKAVFYEQDIDGYWVETSFAEDLLQKFDIAEDGDVLYNERSLLHFMEEERDRFHAGILTEQKKREEAQKRKEEEDRQREEDVKRRFAEELKRREKLEKEQAEAAEKRRLEKERQAAKEQKRREEFRKFIESGELPSDRQVLDENGVRWVRCEFCGKAGPYTDFSSYGGAGRINLGTCNECQNNNPEVAKRLSARISASRDPVTCPKCGGKLIRRRGRYGDFWGCDNYPDCTYTRRIFTR